MSKIRFVGLDVHADTIAVAVAEPGGEVRSLGIIPNRSESVRKTIGKLGPVGKRGLFPRTEPYSRNSGHPPPPITDFKIYRHPVFITLPTFPLWTPFPNATLCPGERISFAHYLTGKVFPKCPLPPNN